MFKNLTIGKKIGLGFGVVLSLLALVGTLSYTGVGGIVANASEVITGNKLDGNLAQKEVDHLNWANQVSALLTDDSITQLSVETDDHQCGFGKWLYGEGRKEAEQQIPSIAPLLAEIEKYHADLHTSAIEIGNKFQQADATLPGTLAAREVDHLDWAAKVNALFLENLPELHVTTDPNQCALGKWLNSDNARQLAAADPAMGRLLDALKQPHATLHGSAIEIEQTYEQVHPGLVDRLRQRLDDHRRWSAKLSEQLINNEQPNVLIDPTKCAFGKWLNGDECKQLVKQWPAFAQVIENVRTHHDTLHESAGTIAHQWRQVHPGLEGTLLSRLDDHRKWSAAVSAALLAHDDIHVETDRADAPLASGWRAIPVRKPAPSGRPLPRSSTRCVAITTSCTPARIKSPVPATMRPRSRYTPTRQRSSWKPSAPCSPKPLRWNGRMSKAVGRPARHTRT